MDRICGYMRVGVLVWLSIYRLWGTCACVRVRICGCCGKALTRVRGESFWLKGMELHEAGILGNKKKPSLGLVVEIYKINIFWAIFRLVLGWFWAITGVKGLGMGV